MTTELDKLQNQTNIASKELEILYFLQKLLHEEIEKVSGVASDLIIHC